MEVFLGKYQYCDPKVVDGTWKCSKYPKNFDVWLDYADTGVAVNKQPGDKLKLNIYSFDATTLQVYYNTNFIEGNCNGNFNVVSGINTCELTVKDNIEDATQYINIEGKIIRVNIINDPQLLVVTDSEKLTQQFQFESNGVRAVLKQAYANAKDSGVVYDLSWYKDELGVNNPFTSFISYFEKITKPNMVDNSYSLAVSDFIKEKCEDCKDVMIVGDDFVVPGYRTETVNYDSDWYFLWLNEHPETSFIYSDSPYITRKKTFGEINSLFIEDGEKKKVALIYSSNINQEALGEINNLKNLIQTKYSINPEIIDSSSVACNSFNKLKGKTLIIIGDKSSNNLLPCYLTFESDFNNSVSIERNLWSNKKDSAVIIDEKERTILALEEFIKDNEELVKFKEKSKVFVHPKEYLNKLKDMQITLDDGTHITIEEGFRGYIMGQCEYIPGLVNSLKCSAFDMTVSSIPGVGIVTDARDAALICPEFVSEGGTLNGVVCGASTGGAITSVTTILFGVTIVGGVASEGADIALSMIKNIAKAIARVDKRIFEIFKFGKNIDEAKNFFKITDWKDIKYINKIIKELLEHQKQIRALIDKGYDVIGKHIHSFDNLVKTAKTNEKIVKKIDELKPAGELTANDIDYFRKMLNNKDLKVKNFRDKIPQLGGYKYTINLDGLGKNYDEASVFIRENYEDANKYSHQLQLKKGDSVYNFRLDTAKAADGKYTTHANLQVMRGSEEVSNPHIDLDLIDNNRVNKEDDLDNFLTLINSMIGRGELP